MVILGMAGKEVAQDAGLRLVCRTQEGQEEVFFSGGGDFPRP